MDDDLKKSIRTNVKDLEDVCKSIRKRLKNDELTYDILWSLAEDIRAIGSEIIEINEYNKQ